MAETVAGQAVDLINQTGIMDVIIRFLLGFVITYGILEKAQAFGKNQQKLHVLIALAIGLFAVISFN